MTLSRPVLASLLLILLPAGAGAQTYAPQTSTSLSVTFQAERMGGSRVLIFGEVRNSSGTSCERVVVLVQGLDDDGKVVAAGRAYVSGSVPGKGSAPFEVRLLTSAPVKRYRVQVESFEFISN